MYDCDLHTKKGKWEGTRFVGISVFQTVGIPYWQMLMIGCQMTISILHGRQSCKKTHPTTHNASTHSNLDQIHSIFRKVSHEQSIQRSTQNGFYSGTKTCPWQGVRFFDGNWAATIKSSQSNRSNWSCIHNAKGRFNSRSIHCHSNQPGMMMSGK